MPPFRCTKDEERILHSYAASLMLLLSKFRWLTDAYVVEFFVKNHWCNLPSSWQACLGDLDLDQIAVFLSGERKSGYTSVWPMSLLALCAATQSLALNRHPDPRSGDLPHPGDNIQLDHCFKYHVKDKKRHEIKTLAAIINDASTSSNVSRVVDVGGGQGHLTRLLSVGYGLKVVSIEAAGCHVNGANKVDRKVEVLMQKREKKGLLEITRPHVSPQTPVHIVCTITADVSVTEFIRIINKNFGSENVTDRTERERDSNDHLCNKMVGVDDTIDSSENEENLVQTGPTLSAASRRSNEDDVSQCGDNYMKKTFASPCSLSDQISHCHRPQSSQEACHPIKIAKEALDVKSTMDDNSMKTRANICQPHTDGTKCSAQSQDIYLHKKSISNLREQSTLGDPHSPRGQDSSKPSSLADFHPLKEWNLKEHSPLVDNDHSSDFREPTSLAHIHSSREQDLREPSVLVGQHASGDHGLEDPALTDVYSSDLKGPSSLANIQSSIEQDLREPTSPLVGLHTSSDQVIEDPSLADVHPIDLKEPSLLAGTHSTREQHLREPFSLVGLHTCGDLGPTILRVFVKCPEAKVLALVGCCYMKMDCVRPIKEYDQTSPSTTACSNRGFPMSRAVDALGGDEMTFEPLELACHFFDNYYQRLKDNDPSLILQAYRAMLEILIQEQKPELVKKHAGIRQIKKATASIKKKTVADFESYAEAAFTKLGLNFDPQAARKLEEQHRPHWKRLITFHALRQCLAPVIESLVLVDRMLYLLENGIESHLAAVFDPCLSPRNFLLQASKS